MPGSIQVTVLEFEGVSSSAKSLKVSMGKRQYQTWDKGDFSFPITKIRENLAVALLDAGGNEIAHQDIRTMQIMEKGCWDEVFSINGGGHAHLKLQFFLTQEDRNRIRIMRESAMKKKLETDPNIKLKLSQVTSTPTQHQHKLSDSQQGIVEKDVVSLNVEASQAGSSSSSAAVSLSSHHNNPEGSTLEIAFTNATDGSHGAPSSGKHRMETESPRVQERVPYETIETRVLANVRSDTEEGLSSRLLGSSVSDKNNTVSSMLQYNLPIEKSKIQDPVEGTPSNVRKMISAFETSQLQEVKSLKKASSVPSQLNRLRKGGLLEDLESMADKSFRDFKDHFAGSISERAGIVPSKPTLEESKTSAVDSMRQSSSETVTSSGRMPEEEQTIDALPSKMLNSSTESSAAEESGSGRETGLMSSTMIMASNPRPITLERYKEECFSGQSSGMWIFPDNTRRLCITTAGKQVSKMVGHHHSEAKTRVKKISLESKNVMHETQFKNEKKQKKIVDQPESESGRSPDNSSNGLIGQVIKIAAIIGFGVLVFLTRQKEPRKKQREENDNLFHVPEYVDTTLKR